MPIFHDLQISDHCQDLYQRFIIFLMLKFVPLLQIDKKDDKHFHAYLDLPSTTRELEDPAMTGSGKFSNSVVGGTHSKIPKIPFFSGPYSLSFKDSFKISTFVCSTKLTHNGRYYADY